MAGIATTISVDDGSGLAVAGGVRVYDLSGVGNGPMVPMNFVADATGNPASLLPPGTAAPVSSVPVVLAYLGAGISRSGTITLGGTAQSLAAANAFRSGLFIQNMDASEDMFINEVGSAAVANAAGSWLIPAKASFTIHTNQAVSVIAATTGHKFTAVEI